MIRLVSKMCYYRIALLIHVLIIVAFILELGDGHYWVNDPGLEIKFPLRFLGDEDDPSHVILELSGEIKWKARGGWMEGIMIRRPKLVTGVTPTNEILRLEHGGRLDIWHCIFDNYGSKGNCVSVDGSEAGGTWERLNVHGASEQFSGLLVNQSANIRLIDVSPLMFDYNIALLLVTHCT